MIETCPCKRYSWGCKTCAIEAVGLGNMPRGERNDDVRNRSSSHIGSVRSRSPPWRKGEPNRD